MGPVAFCITRPELRLMNQGLNVCCVHAPMAEILEVYGAISRTDTTFHQT